MLIPRQHAILDLAKQVGRVTVEDLATRFEVTPQTIRKDLNELCEQRLLARVHGGAILASSVENVGYDARRQIAAREKMAIGRAAAELVPNDASLFINIGTTTEAVAQALHLAGHTDDLDSSIQPAGHRMLARIPRLPEGMAEQLVSHCGTLEKLSRSTVEELSAIPGVSEHMARTVKDALARIAESSILDRYS